MLRISVAVLAVAVSAPAWGHPQGDADRARSDALRALRGQDGDRPMSQELERSKLKWPAYDREVEEGIAEQQKALDAGTNAAGDLLVILENRARMQETPPAFYLYGRFLGVLDKIDEANTQFEKALRLDPYFPWAHHGVATGFARRGKLPEAVHAYRRALELNPSFVRSMEPLAACLIQTEQPDEAERVLRRLIDLSPHDAQAWMTLGKVLASRTRYLDAAAAFKSALERRPNNEEARRLLAYALRKGGKPDEAKAVYDAMLADNKADFQALMGLAEAHVQMGENHVAADVYQRAADAWSPTAGITKQDILGRIEDLRRLPAVEKRNPMRKSPHEWVEILLNSTEPERCREALRVLSTYPEFEPEIYKSFLQALKNRDAQVRVLALREIARRWEGRLDELTPILSIFVVDDPDRLVRAMAANVMGTSRHAAGVPALVKALKDRDEYVFRAVYQALWRTTTSDFAPLSEKPLTAEDMEKLAQQWNGWYEENRDRYRKYESATK